MASQSTFPSAYVGSFPMIRVSLEQKGLVVGHKQTLHKIIKRIIMYEMLYDIMYEMLYDLIYETNISSCGSHIKFVSDLECQFSKRIRKNNCIRGISCTSNFCNVICGSIVNFELYCCKNVSWGVHVLRQVLYF